MDIPDKQNMTKLLREWRSGDAKALNKIEPIVYAALKRIARNQMFGERSANTLQATVLVNDAYLQLVEDNVSWVDSAHFRALAAKIMRRTLIDHAREKNALKRGGDKDRLTLMESRIVDSDRQFDVIELDDILEKLAEFDECKAKVIELIFFGGLSYLEVAEVLGISKATVDRELRIGKAWLHKELDPEQYKNI